MGQEFRRTPELMGQRVVDDVVDGAGVDICILVHLEIQVVIAGW